MTRYSTDFETVEQLAAEICHRSGGDWEKRRTRKNLWRARALAVIHLANGDQPAAEKVMADYKRPRPAQLNWAKAA